LVGVRLKKKAVQIHFFPAKNCAIVFPPSLEEITATFSGFQCGTLFTPILGTFLSQDRV
jgi:hypothetical protein